MSNPTKPGYVPVNTSTEAEPQQFAQGFTVGDHHVRVIVDDEHQPHGRSGEGVYRDEHGFKIIDSRRPMDLEFCPNCSAQHVRTRTKTYPNGVTWACVAVGAIVCFPFCWIPLVIDSTKQTDHYCRSCGQKIGTIHALEGCCVKEEA